MAEVRKRKWDQESEDPAASSKQVKVEENGAVALKAEEDGGQPAAAAIPSTGNAAADAAMAAAARIAAQVRPVTLSPSYSSPCADLARAFLS